ncbi:gamma-glutamyl-gamma-aminobutyrate hydrolase family protein [Leucobacter sp. UT-8R-CII-1-4]|uniref:gamma-glutamyl-gamma-aminobutyrate hydrolase family protein n=1 Tax=Leucobacter sp. UT-8R-CII-1-4 TaxID=3040075 RepID=UPI0024A897F9|nr:gamma-glutamyl-gamma-aminobutyrate hydrolase family protein [Leucobacter sp. UT-8R-CII-1-4]MDI6022703.1 gamma-glutamyl-gamma-aminobutyrate hydrolase family protein [Leucobacter sp. UT-8R-CII-1-4]
MSNVASPAANQEGAAKASSERVRPVIGIPAPIEHATWRIWEGKSHLLSYGYTAHLRNAGASVVLLPVTPDMDSDLDAEAAHLISMLDGLTLAGGSDVDPELYAAPASPKSGPFDRPRDAWESALLRAAIAAQVPVFGICRGLQMMNTVLGGTLIQHLPPHVGSDVHNPISTGFGEHPVRTLESTWLRDAVGEHADVATYHHQAIDRLGEGLIVSAVAEDGTIEGVEDLGRGLVAVQWHPEARPHEGIFKSFVRLCAVRRDERAAVSR